MENAIKTKHNLDFEACPWDLNPMFMLYRVGTVRGQWFSTEHAYIVVSFINDVPGNGHLDDVFEWFEFSCKRDNKALMIMEFMNDRFKKHCIEKRGFTPIPGKDDVIKIFNLPF